MEELKQQLEEINKASYVLEHNKSFFFKTALEKIKNAGFQFETTKEIVELALNKAYDL